MIGLSGAVRNNPVVQVTGRAQQQFQALTKRVGADKALNLLNDGINFVNQNTIGGLVGEGTGKAAEAFAKKANIDTRLALPVLTLVGIVKPNHARMSGWWRHGYPQCTTGNAKEPTGIDLRQTASDQTRGSAATTSS